MWFTGFHVKWVIYVYGYDNIHVHKRRQKAGQKVINAESRILLLTFEENVSH